MSDAEQGTPMESRSAPTVAQRALPPLAASGWRWLPLSAAVIVADHVVKAWMVHHFSPLERVHVLPVLDIILTYNTGAAFSFLSEASGWQRWLFVLLALGVSAALLVWMRRLNARVHGLLACALALIVGGALGNMLDRLTIGRSRELGDDPAARNHPDAVRQSEDLVEILTDEHDAGAPVPCCEKPLLHRGASPRIEPAARAVGDDDRWFTTEFPGDDELLRIAS